MNRILALIIAALMAVALCSCSKAEEELPTDSTSETETQIHILTPEDNEETEWARLDCELSVCDEKGETALSEKNIEMFALVENSQSDAYIELKLKEEAVQAISEYAESQLILYVNKVKIGAAELSDDGTSLILSGIPYDYLCDVATVMRGL